MQEDDLPSHAFVTDILAHYKNNKCDKCGLMCHLKIYLA